MTIIDYIRNKNLKHDFFYIVILALKFLTDILPRKFGLWLFGLFGRLFYLFPSVDKSLTIKHLTEVYGAAWTPDQIRKTARNVYSNLAKNMFDALYLNRLSKDEFNKIVITDDLGSVRREYQNGQGLICVTAHTGCFEMLLQYFVRQGFKSFAVGQKLYDERVDRIITANRTGLNMEYIRRDENPRNIIRKLREGKAFGVLIDQDTSVEGVFADFLGKPAYTPSGAVKLAMKLKIPLFVFTTARQPDDTHRVYVSPRLKFTSSGDFERDLLKNVETVNRVICATIEKYPDQWVWMHKRWNTKQK
jgi:Kdo2-lipid IVA lauroyltransferase/acyltransferase